MRSTFSSTSSKVEARQSNSRLRQLFWSGLRTLSGHWPPLRCNFKSARDNYQSANQNRDCQQRARMPVITHKVRLLLAPMLTFRDRMGFTALGFSPEKGSSTMAMERSQTDALG